MQTASVQQMGNSRRAKAAHSESPRSSSTNQPHASWRWQYAAHPSLMPTVYVPGPVVTERKV